MTNHTKLHGGMHDICFCKLSKAPSEITSSQLLSSLLSQSCCSGSSFLLKEIRGKCYSSCNKVGLLSYRNVYLVKSVLCCSVMSDSLQPHGLSPARLFCPWDFAGKNIEVACNFLLQWIFPTKGSNPHLLCLLHWQAKPLPLCHLESPFVKSVALKTVTDGLC